MGQRTLKSLKRTIRRDQSYTLYEVADKYHMSLLELSFKDRLKFCLKIILKIKPKRSRVRL